MDGVGRVQVRVSGKRSMRTRTCSSAEEDSVWTDWGSCGEDGRQARLGWNSEFTVSDERYCEDEDHQHDGGWWIDPEYSELRKI